MKGLVTDSITRPRLLEKMRIPVQGSRRGSARCLTTAAGLCFFSFERVSASLKHKSSERQSRRSEGHSLDSQEHGALTLQGARDRPHSMMKTWEEVVDLGVTEPGLRRTTLLSSQTVSA